MRTIAIDDQSVSLSVCHASSGCAKTPEQIDVLFGMATPDPIIGNIVLDVFLNYFGLVLSHLPQVYYGVSGNIVCRSFVAKSEVKICFFFPNVICTINRIGASITA